MSSPPKLNRKPPPHKHKVPYWRLSGDGSGSTVVGICYCKCVATLEIQRNQMAWRWSICLCYWRLLVLFPKHFQQHLPAPIAENN